jgi:FAD/FMN-containing dehydrogenase
MTASEILPLVDRFRAVVGAANALTEPADTTRYLVEERGLYFGRTPVVLRPGSVAEVQAIARLAHETGTPLVPQGGNTGLVGGGVPDESGHEVVVSLERLDRIRDVDPAGNTMTVEAGVVLDTVHRAAEEADRLFPLTLGSQGSCRIGGNISTNAGGTAVLAYGNTRDLVLGLEVVLADGRLWNGLRRLRKDNTGYDLKHLFIGAEGTLGIITAAVLKLLPRPKSVAVAYAGVASPEAALRLLAVARNHAGPALTGFELIARIGIEFAVRHIAGAREPLGQPSPWYVLIEVSSGGGDAGTMLEAILAEAFESGDVDDAVIASNLEQTAAFWRLRHDMSEVQKFEGGSIKHDISVPVSLVPAFIEEASAAVVALLPGARPVPFGHLGDGNIHYNVSQPVGADKAAFLRRWGEVNAVVHGIVTRLGGSISAEHGIGRLKRDLLAAVKDPVEMDMMRAIKAALDPKGILNPGRVL